MNRRERIGKSEGRQRMAEEKLEEFLIDLPPCCYQHFYKKSPLSLVCFDKN